MFPQLRKLEEKYSRELVVLGVHSAKFTTEKETDNIRLAILKNEIHHPVVNDRDFKVWNLYGVQAWPTLVLIDPVGKVVGAQSGEQVLEVFDPVIGKVVQEFDRRGLIDRRPIVFEKEKHVEAMLLFPGKVFAHGATDRLFISDTNHNRILLTTLEGQIKDVIGSGKTGLKDGTFEEAQLNKQQGLVLDGDFLYIADTENHAVRVADLKTRTLRTVAGNGRQGWSYDVPAKGTSAALNSPWDLAVANGRLYVAMAGSHQIWEIDLKDLMVRVHAGSGREGLLDGSLLNSWLAQPSGIATDGTVLYFADAEVSAVRVASVQKNGVVRTLVGKGLFDFGDKDGIGDEALLQHTLGVCYLDGIVYVADGYNHKIKRIDPKTRQCETVLGTGKPGNGPNELNEPTGLTHANGKLYIADTNNHRVQVFDLKTKSAATLELKNGK